MKFFDKKLNVVIPAGAAGIGKKIAAAYMEEGCEVFVCDINEQHLTDFSNEYPKSYAQHVDVADYHQVQDFFYQIASKTDAIDILINCAGIAGPTALMENIKPKEWDLTAQININGMFYCSKEAIPMIRKSTNGSIINIASSASFYGFPYRSPYTAAKWAAIGMTKTLAMELGPDQIRVNAVCPGSVTGERIDRVIAADALEQQKTVDEIKATYSKQVSMRTFVDPEDVANLCLFLSSKYGRFISGQAIGVDGHTEGLSTEI